MRKEHCNKGRPAPYKEPPRPLSPIVYKLRKARYDKGICAYDLADRLGYALSTVQEWESGVKTPRPQALRDWAQVLKIDIGTLE